MSIKLPHVGEALVGRMLAALVERGELERVMCAATGTQLIDDVGSSAPDFLIDTAQLKVRSSGKVWSCDGAQTVDVLAAKGRAAVALELKLGMTNMTQSAFRKRFCKACGVSAHSDPRLRGSMVSILDRLMPFDADEVLALDGDSAWTLAGHWWLVIRQKVWKTWAEQPPVDSARILVFDELARLYGDADDFDQLVLAVVAGEFASRWQIEYVT